MSSNKISESAKNIRAKFSDVSIIAGALLDHIEHGDICPVKRELLKAILKEA